MPESEADLVRACAEGDRAAWDRFVDRYGRLIAALARRMILRRVGRAPDADVDEVVGAVFLALLQGDRRLMRRYRPEFRLSTYLGVITRTEAGRWARRRSAGVVSIDAAPTPGEVADARAPDPSSQAVARERAAALQALMDALAALPDRDRLLLSLRFLDGLGYAEIAAILRVSRESVGQLLLRAKQRLAARVPHLAAWAEDDAGGGHA